MEEGIKFGFLPFQLARMGHGLYGHRLIVGIRQRQAQRIITSLKNKAGLKRRGARKNGEWYFEGVAK